MSREKFHVTIYVEKAKVLGINLTMIYIYIYIYVDICIKDRVYASTGICIKDVLIITIDLTTVNRCIFQVSYE